MGQGFWIEVSARAACLGLVLFTQLGAGVKTLLDLPRGTEASELRSRGTVTKEAEKMKRAEKMKVGGGG